MKGLRMLLLLLLLLLNTSISDGQGTKKPGFKTRITTKGLNYMNTIAMASLAVHVKRATIPDVSGKASGFHYRVYNMHVTDFTPPASSLSLDPGHGIAWKAANAQLNLHGDFHYKKWFIRDGGSFDADLRGLSFNIEIDLGSDANGHPTISVRQCSSAVGEVKFRFHGGMAWLYNLFSGKVGNIIKKNLNSQMCNMIKKAVDVDVERKMANIPVTVPFDHKFLLDYRLIKEPTFTASYLETYHKGEITWLSAPGEHSQVTPTAMADPRDASSMVYLALSDYLFNTAADVAQKHGFLAYSLTQKGLPAKYRGILDTSCTGIVPTCIGKLIPQIGAKYPNATAELHMASSVAPKLDISASGLTVTCAGAIKTYVNVPGQSQKPFLFDLMATMNNTVNVSINNEMVYVKIDQLSVNFKVGNSTVGNISSTSIDILKQAIQIFVVQQLNDLGARGFPLPVTKDIKFVNTHLTLDKDMILIATDVTYKPPALGRLTFLPHGVIIDENVNAQGTDSVFAFV